MSGENPYDTTQNLAKIVQALSDIFGSYGEPVKSDTTKSQMASYLKRALRGADPAQYMDLFWDNQERRLPEIRMPQHLTKAWLRGAEAPDFYKLASSLSSRINAAPGLSGNVLRENDIVPPDFEFPAEAVLSTLIDPERRQGFLNFLAQHGVGMGRWVGSDDGEPR